LKTFSALKTEQAFLNHYWDKIMTKNTRNFSIVFALGILFIGAVLGSMVGEVLKYGIPDGVVKDVFLRSININIGPALLDLSMFSITLGFTLKINLIGIIGLGVSYYLLRFWR